MALLVALWVLAILMVLVSSFAIAVRTETTLAATYTRRTQASWLAEAGLQRAVLELRDHPERFTALAEQAAEEDTGEPLVLYLDSQDDDTGLGISDGRFIVRGLDEAARLNLNTSDEELLQRLLPEEHDLVDAILDWRDDDTMTRENGAETDYYGGLDDPYQSRDGLFETVAELLLLRDVTASRFYGSEGLSPLAQPSAAGQSTSQETQGTPLANLFTVYSFDSNLDADGQARIDVTSADEETLLTEFEGVLTAEDVQGIIAYREGGEQGQGQPAPESDEPWLDAPNLLGPDGQPLAAPGSDLIPTGPPPSGEEAGGESGAEEQEAKRPVSVAALLAVLDREKLRQIYDRLTVSERSQLLGLINLNTASAEVLAALPGMDEATADAIVSARQEEPFTTVGDLLRLTEVSDEAFQQVAPLLTTRATAIRLSASGVVGEEDREITGTIEAVVLVDLVPQTDESEDSAERPAPDELPAADEPPQRTVRLIYRRME